MAQLMQIIWKESEWHDHYHPKWQKLEYSDDKEGVSHWISQPGKDFSKPLKKWGIAHASNVQLSFRDEPMDVMGGDAESASCESAKTNLSRPTTPPVLGRTESELRARVDELTDALRETEKAKEEAVAKALAKKHNEIEETTIRLNKSEYGALRKEIELIRDFIITSSRIPESPVPMDSSQKIADNSSEDGTLPLADDSGYRDYSGCLFKFRIPSSGIIRDGIVIEMNEFREYVCQVMVVPMRTSDDMVLPREERVLRKLVRPSKLSKCVVPFDKLEGRWVHRILSSGKKKMGRVKKYLGPRTGPDTRTDQYTKEEVTEHMYRVVYPRYEYEDPKTGEMREEEQTEEHLNSFQVAEWLEVEEEGRGEGRKRSTRESNQKKASSLTK